MSSLPTLTLVLAGALVQAPAKEVSPLTAAEFKKLHGEIVPKNEEFWEKIPWKIDLYEARALAFKVKKPIFLWAMNGHPLGCT